MEFINRIGEKIGVDKILHFFGGGWIVSMFSPFGWIGIAIGFAIMFILSYIKEKWMDSIFDWKDILAACVGSVVSVIIYLIILLWHFK